MGDPRSIPLDRAVVWLAAGKLVFHVLTNGQYGFHRDELATLADARHLAWGYVAYPPLTPFLARLELSLFGTSLTGFRFMAALAQSVALVVAALMARGLGGGRAAQRITAFAVAIAPISLGASSLFQYVAFDYLWFVLLAYLVVRLIDSGDGKCWLLIGLVVGLGVLTKYTMALFALGLVTGTLLTPARAHLRTRWPWLGVAVSLLVVAPNLAWQVKHDFISLDFLRFIHERDVRIGRTAGLVPEQFFVATNPVTVPLWLLGLWVAFRSRRLQVLGLMAVVPFVMMVALRGRGYYLGPIYPMLFALGAWRLESHAAAWPSGVRRWFYAAIATLLTLGSGVAWKILPLPAAGSPSFYSLVSDNDDLAEEIGWPELAREVARIYATIPALERPRTGILCGNYGEAGAIDLYGPELGLPPAISGVNSYWLRGPGDPAPDTLIVVGATRARLETRCASVELAGHVTNQWNVKNEETERHPDIFVCRGLKQPLTTLWPGLRSFG